MRTPSARGSPTVTLRSAARNASTTSAAAAAGTRALRMAVHFCPALTVISRATSLTNKSNSALPGTASGARMLEFNESVSAMKGTACRMTAGCTRRGSRRVRRPGEGHDVLAIQMIEEIAQAAAHQLQRTLGKDLRFDMRRTTASVR